MSNDLLVEQVIRTWQVHNEINLHLLDAVTEQGLQAVPTGSKGRIVARQLTHMNRVRLGWLHYHLTGKRPRLIAEPKDHTPTKAQLKKAFRESGSLVEIFLQLAMKGERKTRAFGGNPVRWMGYLVSHESHHRGQIALALKQNGMKLPEKVAGQLLWGTWMWRK